MADNVARFMTAHPGWRLVVLAGSQHTRKDSGIPPRVARRLPVAQATVVNAAGDRSPLDLKLVTDYYFFASADQLPEPPKIGVTLVGETGDGRPRLRIDRLSPHGKAASAGLKAGDILLEVGGVPVSAMADVQLAMLDRKPGDIVDLKVRRTEDGEERDLGLQVELTALPASPHP
jgi:membrane-associated protease RseP (regulator of RpoE activity)